MAYTFVQQREASSVASPASVSCATMTPTAGNLLVAVTAGDSRYANPGLVDTNNHVWTLRASSVDTGATYEKLCMYTAPALAGATVFTANMGGGSSLAIAVAEYSAAAASFALSGAAYGANPAIVQLNLGNDSCTSGLLGCSGSVLIVSFTRLFGGGSDQALPGVSPNAFTGRTAVWLPLTTADNAVNAISRFEDAGVTGNAAATWGGDSANQYSRVNFVAAAFMLAAPVSTTEQVQLDDPSRIGGTSELFLGSVTGDGTGNPFKTGGQHLKLWAADLNAMLSALFTQTQTLGDANLVLTAASKRVIFQNATLTANRTVTLPSTGLKDGMTFTLVRRAATPGAFTLQMVDPVSSRSQSLAINTNGCIVFRAIDTANWVCLNNNPQA